MYQRWSPREHILKSLTSKVKSLALKPLVFENWPFGNRLKKFCEDFFFWRALALVSSVLGLGLEHSCPWPRECLSSEGLSLALDFFVSLALASSLGSSTPPLLCTNRVYRMHWLNDNAKNQNKFFNAVVPEREGRGAD